MMRSSSPSRLRSESFLKNGIWVLLACAALLPYGNALRADFTYDDGGLILENPSVAPEGPWTVSLTASYWPEKNQAGLYRPLTAFAYRWQLGIWGRNPLPFHALNLALHAGVCFLLFALLRRLAPTRPGFALAASLLFAVHPVHAEAVTSIVGRAELLAALFGIAGYRLWLKAAAHSARNAIVLAGASGACFFLAAASKESAAVWPAMLALHRLLGLPGLDEDRSRGGQAPSRAGGLGRLLTRDLWAWGGVAVYFLLRRIALGSFLGLGDVSFVDNPLFHASLSTRLLTAAKALWIGIARTLAPFTLQPDYSFDSIPLASSWLSPAALGLLAWIALVLLALRVRRTRPLLGWSVFVYAATILPVSNLVIPIGTIFAERLLYLPSLGLLALVALLPSQLAREFPTVRGVTTVRRLAPAFLAVLLLLGAARTWARNRDWANDATLFEKAARTQPKSAKVQNNLGSVRGKAGRWKEAEAAYRAALTIHEDYPASWNGLGNALLMQQRYAEAEAAFQRLLERHPDNREAHVRLGNLRLEVGRAADALVSFDRALALDPALADGWIGRASALFLLERFRESALAWEEAQARAGKAQDLRRHVAFAWLRAGDREKALALLRSAAADHPADPAVLNALAVALLEGGMNQEGLSLAARAVELEPRFENLETLLLYRIAAGDCLQARAVLSSPAVQRLQEQERRKLTERIASACGS